MTVILVSLLGLMIGSAVNAIVWRLYVGRSWVKGRSMCPECKHQLAAKDLVPVVSWLALGGKCRYCKAPIQDSPIVELVTAGLFGLSAWWLAPVTVVTGVLFGLWLVILTMLIVLAVYDARWMLLPDKVMVPAIVLALVYVVAQAVLTHHPLMMRGPLLAALGLGTAFYVLVAATKGRGMGGGDIKLGFLMGLILGIKGLLVALFIAFDVAALVAVILIISHRKKRKDQMAFGPYLVGSTVVAFLFGQQIVAWYLRLNGL
ncbi:MAG: type 4 prepilin peptidase 1, leader peptidase (prepilin peptidase) / N-methyltransferase [Patescibacteria group bacterium]|nr:type 4 prepilin peptidase 1, leader peptidase (prepilin peptidase) / N-methyltransferase [Patescibacteria group bacterium]